MVYNNHVIWKTVYFMWERGSYRFTFVSTTMLCKCLVEKNLKEINQNKVGGFGVTLSSLNFLQYGCIYYLYYLIKYIMNSKGRMRALLGVLVARRMIWLMS